jgi:hypothetical protein
MATYVPARVFLLHLRLRIRRRRHAYRRRSRGRHGLRGGVPHRPDRALLPWWPVDVAPPVVLQGRVGSARRPSSPQAGGGGPR